MSILYDNSSANLSTEVLGILKDYKNIIPINAFSNVQKCVPGIKIDQITISFYGYIYQTKTFKERDRDGTAMDYP